MSKSKPAATMSTRASSITRALDQIGDKWCLLIIQELFLGINSFNDMLAATGVSRGVLSDRLKWLESMDCLRKEPLAPGSRRPRYHLTRKSVDLYANALMALVWEREFFNTPALESIELVHRVCGQRFWPAIQCRDCHSEILPAEVIYRPGPGATRDIRQKKVRRRSSISVMDAVGATALYKNLIHIVGDRWTANVIALAYHGFKRFDEFNRELPVATNILADRLRFLVEQGILVQVPYQEKPLRYEYQLTKMGEGLYPWFLTLLQWGDQWCDAEGNGRPMRLTHQRCGKSLHGQVICSACGGELKGHGVKYRLPE